MARAPLALAKDSVAGQGGTALESESDSNVLLIVGAIGIAGLLLFLVFRGGNTDSEIEDNTVEQVSPTKPLPVANVASPPDSPGPKSNVGIVVEAEDTSGIEKQRAAIAELEGRLNSSRLWATLSTLAGSESTLSIVSGSCEDDAMKPTVQKSATTLRDAGYSEARCFAKHGKLLFIESL